jgi:hypothetical protein
MHQDSHLRPVVLRRSDRQISSNAARSCSLLRSCTLCAPQVERRQSQLSCGALQRFLTLTFDLPPGSPSTELMAMRSWKAV